MPERPTLTSPPARTGRAGTFGRVWALGMARLAAAAVAAHALLLLGAAAALAQTSGPTTSTLAGRGDAGGRMNGPFIVAAVVAGLLLFLYQRRTFGKMQDMFDPDKDRPE